MQTIINFSMVLAWIAIDYLIKQKLWWQFTVHYATQTLPSTCSLLHYSWLLLLFAGFMLLHCVITMLMPSINPSLIYSNQAQVNKLQHWNVKMFSVNQTNHFKCMASYFAFENTYILDLRFLKYFHCFPCTKSEVKNNSIIFI